MDSVAFKILGSCRVASLFDSFCLFIVVVFFSGCQMRFLLSDLEGVPRHRQARGKCEGRRTRAALDSPELGGGRRGTPSWTGRASEFRAVHGRVHCRHARSSRAHVRLVPHSGCSRTCIRAH